MKFKPKLPLDEDPFITLAKIWMIALVVTILIPMITLIVLGILIFGL